jgi:hypothetical protein
LRYLSRPCSSNSAGLRCQVPPEVELKPPLPPDWTPLAAARKPLLDELLLDPFVELPLVESPLDPLDPVDPVDPVDPLDPLDPVELSLDPECEVEPVDELELGEDLLPVLVTAAWLDPGRVTATTPAAATLARDTVAVVALSRRRPCSRSATARVT